MAKLKTYAASRAPKMAAKLTPASAAKIRSKADSILKGKQE